MRIAMILAGILLTGVLAAADQAKGDKRELLADHQTVARFDGVAFHKCLGKTSQCPDHCGNSGDFASFKVLAYVSYQKNGQYGDPKTDRFSFQIEDNLKNPKAPKPIIEAVKALAVGDYVKLNWHHDYVTRGNASSPERPIVLLEKITKEEAEKLIKDSEAKK